MCLFRLVRRAFSMIERQGGEKGEKQIQFMVNMMRNSLAEMDS